MPYFVGLIFVNSSSSKIFRYNNNYWHFIIVNVSPTTYDIVYCTCRENGIKYRRDEAVGGWFSQIGEMHQVHHLWGKPIATSYNNLSSSTIVIVHMYNYDNHSAYKDLPDRTETRRSAWEFPGWDECVVRTGEQE